MKTPLNISYFSLTPPASKLSFGVIFALNGITGKLTSQLNTTTLEVAPWEVMAENDCGADSDSDSDSNVDANADAHDTCGNDHEEDATWAVRSGQLSKESRQTSQQASCGGRKWRGEDEQHDGLAKDLPANAAIMMITLVVNLHSTGYHSQDGPLIRLLNATGATCNFDSN